MLRIRLLEQNVLSCCLNISSDDCEVSVVGRLFHTCAAATGKARSPRVRRRVIGTSSAGDDPERSLRRESTSAARLRLVVLQIWARWWKRKTRAAVVDPVGLKANWSQNRLERSGWTRTGVQIAPNNKPLHNPRENRSDWDGSVVCTCYRLSSFRNRSNATTFTALRQYWWAVRQMKM